MRFVVALAALSLTCVLAGCTGDDVAPQEPVQPTEEATPYPDDPALAGPAADNQPADEPAAPDADGQGGAPSDTPAADDATGSLSDDPFGAPKDMPKMQDEPADDTSDSDATMPPPEEDYGDAFDNPTTAPATPAGKATPSAPGNKKGKKKTSSIGPGAGKVTRYVNAMLLNVRNAPRSNAKVVRRLLGGAKIYVEEKGTYAKIKNGQWVRTKYLSAEPTEKVSRTQVDQAWRGGAPKKKAGKKKK